MIDPYDTDREIQHADVTIRITIPVGTDMTDEDRQRKILRAIRSAEFDGDLELRGALLSDKPTLTRTETMEEAALRQEGEAEAAHEAKLDRQRERYFDRRGHF